FILGYFDGTSWSGDNGYQYIGGDIYEVTFSGGQTFEIDVAVVPVPAAAWLFGTGLVGLIGVARRKAA
ncbi:MAG TPA: VPLPA-CTERM sorting domain-containing protein, partial [Gammaproteobacteria bacterium]|nr:VPLPA-CTERM sorting domain-containing protein [Gammaproteobacteria bacterium]